MIKFIKILFIIKGELYMETKEPLKIKLNIVLILLN